MEKTFKPFLFHLRVRGLSFPSRNSLAACSGQEKMTKQQKKEKNSSSGETRRKVGTEDLFSGESPLCRNSPRRLFDTGENDR